MQELNQNRAEGEEGQKVVVLFLYNDEDQSVHAEETEELDFLKILQHINLGGSIFMRRRRRPQVNVNSRKSVKKRVPKHLSTIEILPPNALEVL